MRITITSIILLIVGVYAHHSLIGGTTEPQRHCYQYGSYVHQLKPPCKPSTEKVTLYSQENDKTNNTIVRNGILVQYPNAKANIVIAHGFMCDKYDVGFLRNMFPQGKFNFLTFDFRAHGEATKGQCCTFGRDEAYDVQAAGRYFKEHPELKKLPTYVYAFSMGAVASIEAQAKDSSLFKAMILDCPFDSTENVIKKALQGMRVSLFGYEFDLPGRTYLERYAFHPYVQEFIKFALKTVAHMDAKNIQTYIYRFSPAESVKKITVPCMFIHCKHDARVPINAIRTIYKSANCCKRLWITNGRNHYDSVFYNPEKYSKRITKFFEMVMDGRIYKNQQDFVVEDKDEVPANTQGEV